MKKVATTSILAFSLAVGGCASNGGLASASTNGCSTGMSTAAGALAGALAGYVISQKNGNSSAQNNRAIALGALAGGVSGYGACIAINERVISIVSRSLYFYRLEKIVFFCQKGL